MEGLVTIINKGMKAIAILVFLSLQVWCSGQGGITIVDPKDFTVTAEPDDSNFEFYSRKLGTNTKASYTAIRKRMMPMYGGVVAYTPTATGNVQARRGLVTKSTSGDIWFVDGFGAGVKLFSSAQAATYAAYDNDQQAAANCVGIYRVTLNNPYGLQVGMLRVRQFGTLSNCQ